MRIEALYSPLKRMIQEILTEAAVESAELSFSFVGRKLIRRLNREYLDHDWVTDVIAFDLSSGGADILVGDIYICVLQARIQAWRFGVTPEEELFRLTAHGTLHLLGHDHQDKAAGDHMFELQEQAVVKHFKRSMAGLLG